MVKELHGGEKDAKSLAILIHAAPTRFINLCKINKPVSSISFEAWLSRSCIKSSALPGTCQYATFMATCTTWRNMLEMHRRSLAWCACDSSSVLQNTINYCDVIRWPTALLK